MNKSELISCVALEAGITKAQVTSALQAFEVVVTSALAEGDTVKLPINGTAGQFLASDLTWKNPTSGGNEPVWIDLVLIAGNGWATGYADGTHKMQVGKDANGSIWIRGAMRNTLNTNNSNFPFSFPSTHLLKIGTQDSTSFVLPHVHWAPLFSSAAGGSASVGNVYGAQVFIITGASIPANSSVFFPQVIVAPAR